MRKIYKYELPEVPGVVMTINEKIIKILSVQYQNGIPTVWAIVDPDDTSVATEIMAFGTGWELPNGVERYVGSLQDPEGYVWHYFSLKLKELKGPVEPSYAQLEETAFSALIQSLGKIGVSAEQAAQVFDMRGLFDAYV